MDNYDDEDKELITSINNKIQEYKESTTEI